MEQFRLDVRDYAGPLRWRWLLTEERSGRALADHQVNLDKGTEEFRAFTDLYRYLWSNAIPDLRAESEAEIAADIGAWAGREVLGDKVCASSSSRGSYRPTWRCALNSRAPAATGKIAVCITDDCRLTATPVS